MLDGTLTVTLIPTLRAASTLALLRQRLYRTSEAPLKLSHVYHNLTILLAFLIRNGYEWITTIPGEGFGWIYTETQTVEVMSFSIHLISWIERKSTPLNKRRHLVNALFKFYSVFGGFVEYIIITIEKNRLLPTIKIISTSQISSFFGIFWYNYRLSLECRLLKLTPNTTPYWFPPLGYSKLRKSIKTHETCFLLIWQILIMDSAEDKKNEDILLLSLLKTLTVKKVFLNMFYIAFTIVQRSDNLMKTLFLILRSEFC